MRSRAGARGLAKSLGNDADDGLFCLSPPKPHPLKLFFSCHAAAVRIRTRDMRKKSLSTAAVPITFIPQCTKIPIKRLEIALDFEIQAILPGRTKNLTCRISLKIKSFAKQKMFYRSDILHSFSISSL